MTAKLSRYAFRKIGGRIVPIRIGAEAATTAKNFSMSALRKMQGMLNKKNAEVAAKFTQGSVVTEKVYHGTNANFKKFSHDKIGSSVGTSMGRGFYFTNKKDVAQGYGKKVKEYFLSIKKPLFGSLNDGFKSKDITPKQMEKIIRGKDLSNYGQGVSSHKVAADLHKYNSNDLDMINDAGVSTFNGKWKQALGKVRKVTGIDGAVAGNNNHMVYNAFNADQIMPAPKKSTIYKDALKRVKIKNFKARKQ